MNNPNQTPIRVMRVIARMNVGGPAVQVTGLMRGFNAREFDHRLYTGFCASDEAYYLESNATDVTAIRIVGFVILGFGIFFEGAIYNNKEWVARVKEMEAKVAAAEVESKKETIKIVQKVVVKKQIVKERGEDVIKYVDREITKYDNTCPIPKEFVKALNDAAKEVK